MRRILFGIALFFLLDAAIFRSGLYASILTYDSMQGYGHHVVSSLERRPENALGDILIAGDSRITEGFNAGLATREFGSDRVEFVQGGIPGASLRAWCYFLEHLDPQARRYRAVVLTLPTYRQRPPLMRDSEYPEQDASLLVPVLSTSEFTDFVRRHARLSERGALLWLRLGVSAVNYRDDFENLLMHPLERVRNYRWRQSIGLRAGDGYEGRPQDMVGLSWDARSGRFTFPERLSEVQRRTIEDDYLRPDLAGVATEDVASAYWMERIVKRYERGASPLILVRLPSTPVPSAFDESHLPLATGVAKAVGRHNVTVLPELSLADLERPELFFDHRHLNSKGRSRLTESLSRLLLQALAESSRLRGASR
jgi:hypothetical protein